MFLLESHEYYCLIYCPFNENPVENNMALANPRDKLMEFLIYSDHNSPYGNELKLQGIQVYLPLQIQTMVDDTMFWRIRVSSSSRNSNASVGSKR